MISLCIKDENDEILDYLIKEMQKSTVSKTICKKGEFKAYKHIIIHYQDTDYTCFINHASHTIAKSITLFFEDKIIKDLIDLNYFYFSNEDKNVIIEEYKLLLSKIPNSQKIYEQVIYPYIQDYFSDLNVNDFKFKHKNMILTGFINFRLKKYIEWLEELISEAVNQFIIDKEYFKFVELLNNYVTSKIPNNLTLNLIYINSEGILLKNNGEFVKLEKFNSEYLSDITFSKNDYILNTLVGMLPNKIVIHLISPRDQFIKTVELIFENKVEICKGCKLCRAYELLQLH